ncbi:alkylated DNA repair protein alkB homolog 8 [Condylostylus longicornis]|uniref:alkylated DNA repair protein alkB homolog 8 n=1 Tax=Condylostylus longicornis TaxID=2530218 RepID=UPI00244E1C5D|nr:alkylated DNA repair protein alkB homolog 8 [Condylostylus longicornis]
MAESKSKISKILRKQKRCQAIISKETGLQSSENPTKIIAICNAGLSTGLEEEVLLKEAACYGSIHCLKMLPLKSYCFLKCADLKSSQNIFNNMHARSNLGQSGALLYLSYFDNLPETENYFKDTPPPGLVILKDFISDDEEIKILSLLEKTKENENCMKHRIVTHYGYEFLYDSNQVDPTQPLSRKIPQELDFLWERLESKFKGLNWYKPDQLTVNVYKVGQGIPPHVDTHSAFLDPIFSLSLEDDVVMNFRKLDEHRSIVLPKKSLLIMSGESRYEWTHGIKSRVMDIVTSDNGALKVRPRKQRTSLTFRKLRCTTCDCAFETFCDSKIKDKETKNIFSSKASQIENANVHKVYDKIALHFNETRHTPWPKVATFIESFKSGAILLDVGCGNGKYLDIINKIVTVGCDRSEELLKVCATKKCNIFKCDCLSIPFRNGSVDGCLSIAVIHHLATEERRFQALKEIARVLTPGGKALIYVWAKNQCADSKKSSYLRQKTGGNDLCEKTTKQIEDANAFSLPIHTNRTEFKAQDILVPWKLKNSEEEAKQVFLRYYHVFEESELENLCRRLNNIEIMKSYYDQGNWCVIIEKIK